MGKLCAISRNVSGTPELRVSPDADRGDGEESLPAVGNDVERTEEAEAEKISAEDERDF